MNKPLIKKSIRDIWGRKGSLFALALIMAIGVAGYVAMSAIYRDMNGAKERYFDRYSLADFVVDLKRAPDTTIAEIESLDNVAAARGRVRLAARLELPNVREPITGSAVSLPVPRRPVLNDVNLIRGGWFSDAEASEVILIDEFAAAHNLRPGDRIEALLLDKMHDLLIVGTAMAPEFVSLIPSGGGFAPDPEKFGVIYLPEAFLQKSGDLEGAWNQIVGVAHDESKTAIERQLDQIERRFDAYGVLDTGLMIDQPTVRYVEDELAGVQTSGTIMPTIFLGVAALVLNVLLSRIVAQERIAIGTLRALGYSRRAITVHYLFFAWFVGGMGGVGGLALGLWMQNTIIELYRQFYTIPDIQVIIYPDVWARGMFISLIFATLGAWKAARSASRLQPAEAMRPPMPEKGGATLPERIPILWNALTFRWRMAVRAIFRNPFRSFVTICASFIATSLIVTALSNYDSLIYLMSYEFEQTARQDLTVSLRDPVGRGADGSVERMTNVIYAEPQLGVVCDLTNGPASKRVGVTALTPNGKLFTPMDADGAPIQAPSEGLILSDKLGRLLNAPTGTTLRLRPLIGERRETQAVVAGWVTTYLGLGAYADIDYLSRLIGEEWAANSLLALTAPDGPGDPLIGELEERPAVIGLSRRARAYEQLTETFGDMMAVSIGIMILLAGAIAFGSVLNTALVSLSERRRDVGTLRVLGYHPREVGRIFSGESLLLNGTGALIGLLGGIGLARLISKGYDTELYRFPAIVYPERLFQSLLLMAIIIGAAQFIIYRLIRTMDWLEVMKTRE